MIQCAKPFNLILFFKQHGRGAGVREEDSLADFSERILSFRRRPRTGMFTFSSNIKFMKIFLTKRNGLCDRNVFN